MKSLVTTLLLIAAALITSGQKVLEDRAEAAFQSLAYHESAELYQRIFDGGNDRYVIVRNLAYSYWMLRDFEQAEIYAEKAAAMNTQSDDELLYAQALKANGKYQLALESFARFERKDPKDKRGLASGESMGMYRGLLNHPGHVELINLKHNTSESDFGVSVTPEGDLIFASARRVNPAVRRTYAWDRSAFLELFRAPHLGEYFWGTPRRMGAPFNTKFHESSFQYRPGTSEVAFTRNNHEGSRANTSKDGFSKLNLFFATEKDGVWSEPREFRYNNSEWSSGHPAFTADGLTLYFTSDRPGGYGGTDIYRCRWVQGVWTNPVNMGPQVNSAGDEMFPWVSHEGTLFFASDGHPGLGGLDVFELRQDVTGWVPVNLGAPYNSSHDDFAYSEMPDGQSGFLSSNRGGGKGSDDIYRFLFMPDEQPMLSGTVVNSEDGQPLPGARVTAFNAATEPCGNAVADAFGTFEIPITEVSGPLHLHAENGPGWSSFDATDIPWPPINGQRDMGFIPLTPSTNVQQPVAELPQTVPGSLVGTTITLTEVGQGTPQMVYTGAQGAYQVHLSPGRQYEVRMDRPGYFSRVEQITAPAGRTDLSALIDPHMQAYTVGQAIELENIHYDFDQHFIRPDAAMELDKLVKILRDNPGMRVELASHTDARGNDWYNLKLSERRAHAAVNYLIRRGIDRRRLEWRGYGETMLRNHCHNGRSCPDYVHEENRRTEFTVLRESS